MAYVYRHIRLDKNQPFYIGIGSDNNGKYKRAFTKKDRNNVWNRIVNKTSYEVQIIIDNVDKETAAKKEIEFISLYGRLDLMNGILCNQTKGGDGVADISKQRRINMSNRISKPICKYSKEGKFIKKYKSCVEASLDNNIIQAAIRNCVKGKSKTCGGFIFKAYNNSTNNIKDDLPTNKKWKKVNQYDLKGNYISTYESIMEAARKTKVTKATIDLCVGLRNKTAMGFIFRYYNGNTSNLYNLDLSQRRTFKKIAKYSIDNEFIENYDSLISASKKNNINKTCISTALNGKQKTAGGFIWKFI